MKRFVLLVLAILAIAAYLPILRQPFLEDDFPNLILALHYGPPSGWYSLMMDPIFRVRATSYLWLGGLHGVFGLNPAGYYAAMILLHVVNTWLVYALGVWDLLGYRLTAWAAAFFAVYEGHQEAVMWVSAVNEPLMVLFGLLALICWIGFLNGRGWGWYALSLMAFGGALLSKESGVIFMALLALPLWPGRISKVIWLAPFGFLALLAVRSVLSFRKYSFRFHDGSFSLSAPFWITGPVSFARLFWLWGVLALIAIFIWRSSGSLRIVLMSVAWSASALLPYIFLTYSYKVPSRQVYLASVGLSLVVGLALSNLFGHTWKLRPWIVVAVCAIVVLGNTGYLWTKKRTQFLERAEPTERLISFAKANPGPIYVKCFPRPPIVAESAIDLMVPGRTHRDLLWTEQDARKTSGVVTFCYVP